ncbi:hypothetical protein [Streptomyces sp. NPDC031705]|uniref:hypothetical protein n=1 Tax=Streptomyces sp. NPDC031705 TaxID=3155729 RepID=UPI0033D98A79
MVRVKRAIGMLAATAMAVAVPVMAASPAQASYTDCTNYMHNMGYIVGANVQNACQVGENGMVGQNVCLSILQSVGVRTEHAQTACQQAARD